MGRPRVLRSLVGCVAAGALVARACAGGYSPPPGEGCTVIETINGGFTELIGGLLYKNRERIGPAPAFVNDNANVSLSYKVTGRPYPIHVAETRGETTRELPREKTYGRRVPLYVGWRSRPQR